MHNNNVVNNQHIFSSPQNDFPSNHNNMMPSYPFNLNVAPQSCNQMHPAFNQRPIVPSNIQGFNVNGNNIQQHVPSMHCFQQHNSSISNSNTCNNQAMNENSSCQHASNMATVHNND